MSRSQLLTFIIVAMQAILLMLCGYSVDSPVFWIAFGIVIIDYWHSHREWPLEQHWLGFGVQMFPLVLWAFLIWGFDICIKMAEFYVIMISSVIASFCGLHQKRKDNSYEKN